MSVDAKGEIVIARPRKEVAAVMFDPKQDTAWIGGLKNSFPMSSGLLKKDSRWQRTGDFLSRGYSANIIVLNSEPEKFVEFSSDEPFEMKARYDLDDAPEGTSVKIRIQSIGENEYKKMPAATFAKAVNDAINADLRRLKKFIENL